MNGERLPLYVSSASVLVSVTVIVLVLSASAEGADGYSLDLSRGKGVALLLSSALLAASLLIARRSWSASRPRDGPSTDDTASVDAVPSGESEGAAPVADEGLLDRLGEDERRLYEMVQEAGGAMLQMHIVATNEFSKAKVTRLLDRLEKRGLVIRERHGMTNRVRIIR